MDHDEAIRCMKAIWPHIEQQNFSENDYIRVVDFVESQKRFIKTEDTLFSADSVLHVALIAKRLGCLNSHLLTKQAATEVIADYFLGQQYLAETLTRTIDLVLRIMLTLDIRSSSATQICASGSLSTYISWEGERTILSQAILAHFRRPSPNGLNMKTGKVDPALTMAHLSDSKGLTVFWTSNLADHLNMNWKSRVITIYEHKICLWNHLNSETDPIIPREILEEAIDTFNLLFPLNDDHTKGFLKQHGKPFYGLGNCKRRGVYDLDKFHFWRDHIADLMEIMGEEPRGLQQLALSKDRRNLRSIAAFWIATLVAILTIFSIAFGTVQTVYSIKQYNLAVAQACAEPQAKTLLPQYCS